MTIWITAVLLLAVFATSTLSGVFGMAGGLVLLGILLTILPVGTAIAVQGAIQIVANGSRAFLSRAFIDWKILGTICLGLLVAGIILFIVRYTPDLATVCITIGLLPVLVWIPPQGYCHQGGHPGRVPCGQGCVLLECHPGPDPA